MSRYVHIMYVVLPSRGVSDDRPDTRCLRDIGSSHLLRGESISLTQEALYRADA